MQSSKAIPPKAVDRLVFVYNADSGVLNLFKDIAHKLLSPSTYPCSLCDLTYSAIGEKKSWVSFRKKLPVAQEYLHIDEFTQQYVEQKNVEKKITLAEGCTVQWAECENQLQYPAIFALSGETLVLVATKQQLDACQSLTELKSLVLSLLP